MTRSVYTSFLRKLSLVALIGLMYVVATPAPALAQLHGTCGANPAAILPTVNQFRTAIGGADNGVGGSYQIGRREVSWEDVPDNLASPEAMPYNFYNSTVPKGLVLNSVGNLAIHSFRVSARLGNPSGTPALFGDINSAYPSTFQTFSGNRIMAANNSNTVVMSFVVPGTNIPATVSSFGAIVVDIDVLGSYMEVYGPHGERLFAVGFNTFNGGLCFMGFDLSASGARIAQVVLRGGSAPLGSGTVDGPGVDVAAFDDFIYSEPRAMAQGTHDFDGDAGTDVTIYRPSTGQWFIVRSGGLPAIAVKWGEAGDIPVAGDYDGDRISDIAVFRPASGTWFIAHSSGLAPRVVNWGQNGDIPVPGDYDRDGRTDIAVYRPTTGQHFLVRSSNGSQTAVQWGQPGDIPVSGRGPF